MAITWLKIIQILQVGGVLESSGPPLDDGHRDFKNGCILGWEIDENERVSFLMNPSVKIKQSNMGDSSVASCRTSSDSILSVMTRDYCCRSWRDPSAQLVEVLRNRDGSDRGGHISKYKAKLNWKLHFYENPLLLAEIELSLGCTAKIYPSLSPLLQAMIQHLVQQVHLNDCNCTNLFSGFDAEGVNFNLNCTIQVCFLMAYGTSPPLLCRVR